MNLPTNWHGKIDLVYTHSDGKTEIKSAFCQAPLKIQRA
ncbi:MAG: urease accessory protein UreD, partial [Cyanobacteria bacterium]|nr:urease accessory protein UreD [Cyanobacteria bacterium CG_2015-04_32_10]